MNNRIEKQITEALAQALLARLLPDTSFRTFKNYLHHTKQFQLKCILLENRYLYNSFVVKAKLLCAQGVSS